MSKYKPDPTMINIIQNNASDNANFVMVGDRNSDIIAANSSEKKHLTKTIAVQPIKNNMADYTITHAKDINISLIGEVLAS